MISITTYFLVVYDCDASVLGVTYMVLAVCLLLWQPKKGRWSMVAGRHNALQEVMLGVPNPGSRQAQTLHHHPIMHTHWIDWVALFFLSFFALVDMTVQATLPALAFYLPDDAVDVMHNALGMSETANGADLMLRVLRPVVILGCIAVYRTLYCIGVLHNQLQHESFDDETLRQRRLSKQYGIVAFIKRFLVLHSSKIVIVTAFAASMQFPSVFGAAFVGMLLLDTDCITL